jgi:hypothetical protein
MKNLNTPQIPKPEKFPDISRFTKWLSELEETEKQLSPEKRIYKWGIVMSALFLLFITSFFLFPSPSISHQLINPMSATAVPTLDPLKKEKSMTFDMPVDSFELYLKKEIHEKLPE